MFDTPFDFSTPCFLLLLSSSLLLSSLLPPHPPFSPCGIYTLSRLTRGLNFDIGHTLFLCPSRVSLVQTLNQREEKRSKKEKEEDRGGWGELRKTAFVSLSLLSPSVFPCSQYFTPGIKLPESEENNKLAQIANLGNKPFSVSMVTLASNSSFLLLRLLLSPYFPLLSFSLVTQEYSPVDCLLLPPVDSLTQ